MTITKHSKGGPGFSKEAHVVGVTRDDETNTPVAEALVVQVLNDYGFKVSDREFESESAVLAYVPNGIAKDVADRGVWDDVHTYNGQKFVIEIEDTP